MDTNPCPHDAVHTLCLHQWNRVVTQTSQDAMRDEMSGVAFPTIAVPHFSGVLETKI
jgi:hypothetical protein